MEFRDSQLVLKIVLLIIKLKIMFSIRKINICCLINCHIRFAKIIKKLKKYVKLIENHKDKLCSNFKF
jgi:hypothetical protein